MSTRDPKTVLVGIPTLNEETHIEACIRSLMHGEPGLEHVQIIVADGGSTDRTIEIVERLGAEFANVSLISNPERLQAAAMNHVVESATSAHKVLVRCDAHSVYPPNYVFDVAWQLLDRGVQGLATTMDASGTNCFSKAAAWIVDTPLGSGGSGHRGGTKSGYVAHGHHAGLEIEAFRQIGGYNPTFAVNEDAEYDHRLGEAGGKIWLASEIRLGYAMRPTARALARQYWKYGRGRARTIQTHKMRPQLRQLIPVVNVLFLAFSVLLLTMTWAGLFWLLLYLTLLIGASALVTFKNRDACGLLAGPALAVMHLSWGLGFLRQLALNN